ncbi:MAG: AAA family ATPase [Pseudomonadota bacterium]
MSGLDDYEKGLLANPFDTELRAEYADALLNQGAVEAAQQQFELVLRAESDNAQAQTGIARCLLDSGDRTGALEAYRKARTLPDFLPVASLETLIETSQPTWPALSVVGGSDKVTALRPQAASAVTFDDVVGMEKLKKQLRLQIIEPFRNPGLFQRFRKKAGGGVLLYGPPGCGKTLMARAIAGECGATFIAVGISDVLTMWMGESERNLAARFEQAREEKPSVLFFDELDALAYSRSKAMSSGARTVVNEFLAQLDGFADANDAVLVLAATNMPWDVDPAMKRPGRFARQVFVPPPDAVNRAEMIRQKTAGIPTEPLDADALAKATDFYSGADIDGLIDAAKDQVLAEILDGGSERGLSNADFAEAIESGTPSTLEWLKTARNLVKFSGKSGGYGDVAAYLKSVKKF